MKNLKIGLVVLIMLVGIVSGTTVAAAAGATTCNSGPIAAGTYSTLAIAGNCSIPTGTVVVQGNLTILPGASLDVSSQQATLVVYGNVTIGNGATFILGCSTHPEVGTPCHNVGDRINGSLNGNGASMWTIYSTTIQGSVSLQGGSGYFSTFEDDTVYGNVSINGYQGVWLGFIRNHVNGSVSCNNTNLSDPDANEIVTNVIGGNLACSGNSPAPAYGDANLVPGFAPDVVHGVESGQCVGL